MLIEDYYENKFKEVTALTGQKPARNMEWERDGADKKYRDEHLHIDDETEDMEARKRRIKLMLAPFLPQ